MKKDKKEQSNFYFKIQFHIVFIVTCSAVLCEIDLKFNMKLNVKSNHYSRKGNINNIRYDKNRIQCLGLEESGPHHHFIEN